MSKVKKLHTRREKLQNLNKNDVLDFMMNNAIFLVFVRSINDYHSNIT